MKIVFRILLVTSGLVSCVPKKKGVAENNIIAKYKVFDELFSPQHINCEAEIKSFKEMNSDDCSFKLDNEEFDIIEKFKLNGQGNLKEYWTYKSEGPLIYTIKDLMKDQKLTDLINVENLSIHCLGATKIIDSGDTLDIERIIDNLIFVKRSQEMKNNHVRYLYELNRNS